LFAFPWDLPASTPLQVVARDAAGNEAISGMTYKLFPKRFQQARIELNDAFLNRVVPEVLSQTPSLKSTCDVLKDFLLINGDLRPREARELIELARGSRHEFLWHGPFTQLGNSQVEAAFADARTYIYNGHVVDHQTHLGFDLAVTASHP